MRPIPFFPVIIFLSAPALAEETDFEVPPILLEADSPAELLHEQNPVPAPERDVIPATSSGTLDSTLTQELPVSVTPATEPGGLSQIRGLGRSAEEVSVEAFGVPLNPAQGGGFNFSIFPQFVWSSLQYRPGPVVGGSDPRAVAGGLVLRPWTGEAAEDPQTRSRVTAFYSGEGLAQFSTAYDAGSSALLVGWSTGDVRGPTTTGSFQLSSGDGDSQWKLHVLGTSLELDTPGTGVVLTSRRIIPIVQNETKSGKSRLYRSSFFYDGSQQEFASPATLDRTHQLGAEHAAFVGPWSYGAAARHIRFEGTDVDPPSETQLRLRVLRKVSLGEGLVLQPGLQAVGVTQVGSFPEALVLGEKRLLENAKLYARIGVSRKIPSLVDRYYRVPFYVGNPELKPETAWTAQAGFAAEGLVGWSWDFSALGQTRSDAIVGVTLPDSRASLANQGSASIASFTAIARKELSARWEVRAAVTAASSTVTATGADFPYLPDALGVLSVIYQSPLKDLQTQQNRWRVSANARGSTRIPLTAASSLPGYGYVDLQGQVHVTDGVMLGAQVDNLFGRSIVLISGEPPLQRAVSAMVSGTF